MQQGPEHPLLCEECEVWQCKLRQATITVSRLTHMQGLGFIYLPVTTC